MNDKKMLTVLGSTGSIGTQTLDVIKERGYGVKALSARSNTALLEEQAREFKPEYVCVTDEKAYADIKARLSDTDIKLISGKEGLCETAALKTDMLINALVGVAGLWPTLSAIEAGNRIGLANKETMVVGGDMVNERARLKKVDIIPIDSEHSAIFQSLTGNKGNKIRKIILTASGGPFFGYTREMLKTVTMEQALAHPNWKMGKKITTDSATLMNKGLELIEAVRLFGVSPDDIEVVIHRQSILHSAVEFEDGAIIGQMGTADMRLPIQYAITYPERFPSPCARLSLTDVGTLTFGKADEDTFTCLPMARETVKRGGTAPCILNSANEAAVALFLDGKLPFYRIADLVISCCEKIRPTDEVNERTIAEADAEAREFINAGMENL